LKFQTSQNKLKQNKTKQNQPDIMQLQLLITLFIINAVFVVSQPTTPTNYVPSTSSWVNAHNAIRNAVNPPAANMVPVRWDKSGNNGPLVTGAKNNAASCVYSHKTGDGYGENIAYIAGNGDPTRFYQGETGVTNLWGSEVKDWTYNPIRQNDCAPNAVCGHYTQIIWAETTEIGCWISYCSTLLDGQGNFLANNAYYSVCKYGPAGNYIGQYPYVAESLGATTTPQTKNSSSCKALSTKASCKSRSDCKWKKRSCKPKKK